MISKLKLLHVKKCLSAPPLVFQKFHAAFLFLAGLLLFAANAVNAADVSLQVHGLLQGAYVSESGLMRDDLRLSGLLPVTQPYGDTDTPFDYQGIEIVSQAVLTLSGSNAAVDWVLLELRSATDNSVRVAAKAAILQADGSLVDPQSGSKDLRFVDVDPGDYYVALRHRNHLGVMTSEPLTLSDNSVMVDFTSVDTPVKGNHSRYIIDGFAFLWSGDANYSNSLTSSGPSNDVNSVLEQVLLANGNTSFSSNYLLKAYSTADFNLDGYVTYAGPDNDTNINITNVLLHPENSSFASNYIVAGQLPDANDGNENNFPKLANGDYSTEGTSFYFLNLKSTANIDFTENSHSSIITIYDADVNQLYLMTESELISLQAGLYTVKIVNEYNSDSVTVYSPSLDKNRSFPQLKNGEYKLQGTSLYYLTLHNKANIDFTEKSYSSTITFYDTDMNQLYLLAESETKNFPAGSYIVKITNEYSSDSVTIYSPFLDIEKNLPQLTNDDYGFEGISFHALTLNSTSNIDFTENGHSSTITIYDADMNKLHLISNSETKGFQAGSYIVKIINEYSYDSITVYSPKLDYEQSFPQLENGRYSTEGTSFYYLTLHTEANIDFTESSGFSIVTIYDSDMSKLHLLTDSDTKALQPGSYIVKIINKYNSDSVTVYSPNLGDEQSFPQLENGEYKAQGASFHYLTLNNEANIDFTESSYSSIVTIYDANMNQLHFLTSSETRSFPAGSYIVKIINDYSSDSVIIYSPSLGNKPSFPQLTNGDYEVEGTSFYYLTLQSSANIDFTENSHSSVIAIYDIDMNQLHLLSDSETKGLQAGSYIVKIINDYSSDSVTVFGIP